MDTFDLGGGQWVPQLTDLIRRCLLRTAVIHFFSRDAIPYSQNALSGFAQRTCLLARLKTEFLPDKIREGMKANI